MTLVATGSYTADKAGRGTGLQTWWWDGQTLTPAGSAALDSPSFLAWHPTLPVLYAVSETTDGSLTAFQVDEDGNPTPMATVPTGGADPCHLLVTEHGLIVSNYSSGSLAVLGVDASGVPQVPPTVVAHTGSGPVADRQQGPHVHQAVALGDEILVQDLGADAVVRYRFEAGKPVEFARVNCPPGSGPRHVAVFENSAFLTGELEGSVLSYSLPNWQLRSRIPASASERPNFPSHLAISGHFLLVANRGPDTLTVFELAGSAPELAAEVPTGRHPRHFAVVGSAVLVAAQESDRITVLELDQETGRLTETGAVAAWSPTCVAVRP